MESLRSCPPKLPANIMTSGTIHIAPIGRKRGKITVGSRKSNVECWESTIIALRSAREGDMDHRAMSDHTGVTRPSPCVSNPD